MAPGIVGLRGLSPTYGATVRAVTHARFLNDSMSFVTSTDSPDITTIGVISDTHGLLRPEALTALMGVERYRGSEPERASARW